MNHYTWLTPEVLAEAARDVIRRSPGKYSWRGALSRGYVELVSELEERLDEVHDEAKELGPGDAEGQLLKPQEPDCPTLF